MRKNYWKVDFLDWKQDQGHRDTQVMRTYHIQNREDYHKYNKICGDIRKLAHKLSLLQPTDPFRIKHEQLLLEKLYNIGYYWQNRKYPIWKIKLLWVVYVEEESGWLCVDWKWQKL